MQGSIFFLLSPYFPTAPTFSFCRYLGPLFDQALGKLIDRRVDKLHILPHDLSLPPIVPAEGVGEDRIGGAVWVSAMCRDHWEGGIAIQEVDKWTYRAYNDNRWSPAKVRWKVRETILTLGVKNIVQLMDVSLSNL